VHPSRGELDKEQDVERLQEHRLRREEVARERSPALRSEELAPGQSGAPWCGPEAGSAEDPPDRARSDPDPELAELSLDPDASPPRVLPPETDNEIGHLTTQWRPAGDSSPVGPLASHELAVPPQQRLGRDHERGPSIPGEGPARRREERPIPVAKKFRPAHRPPEHIQLVAEHGVLELELRHAPPRREQTHEANQKEVRERSQGARDATDQRQSEQNTVLEPDSQMMLWPLSTPLAGIWSRKGRHQIDATTPLSVRD